MGAHKIEEITIFYGISGNKTTKVNLTFARIIFRQHAFASLRLKHLKKQTSIRFDNIGKSHKEVDYQKVNSEKFELAQTNYNRFLKELDLGHIDKAKTMLTTYYASYYCNTRTFLELSNEDFDRNMKMANETVAQLETTLKVLRFIADTSIDILNAIPGVGEGIAAGLKIFRVATDKGYDNVTTTRIAAGALSAATSKFLKAKALQQRHVDKLLISSSSKYYEENMLNPNSPTYKKVIKSVVGGMADSIAGATSSSFLKEYEKKLLTNPNILVSKTIFENEAKRVMNIYGTFPLNATQRKRMCRKFSLIYLTKNTTNFYKKVFT